MAEILLSLTIIGVVAVITLPSLTGNINERTWNTQRKALYARMSQAIALMPSVNGYGKFVVETDSSGSTSIVEDTAAEAFVTEGLSKVLKINNICDAEHLQDCGISSKITTSDGSIISLPLTFLELGKSGYSLWNGQKTKAAAFETQNGESIAVYYNPYCKGDWKKEARWRDYVGGDFCANFVFDLNGNKGPNTVGKDIGIMSVLYSTDSSVVMPVPFVRSPQGRTYYDSKKACKELGENHRQATLDEVGAIYVNQKLMGATVFSGYSGGVWCSDSLISTKLNPFHINESTGFRYQDYAADTPYGTFCIQR